MKWVDQLTNEHLCDEAVVFDEKLYTMTPQRKVRVYPELKYGRVFSIVKGRRHVLLRKQGPIEDQDVVEISFLFDDAFQAKFDKVNKRFSPQKSKSQSLLRPKYH